MAFGTLNVALRDFARFGTLYMNHGKWQGEQLVPAQWVRDSVTPDAPHLMPGKNPSSDTEMGYGYQWWIPRKPKGDFMALGVYGQSIYINPQKKLVVVRTSAFPQWSIEGGSDFVMTEYCQYLAEKL